MSRYRKISDPAGWLDINSETGEIKVKSEMDRESVFVKEEKYTALIGAYDDGKCLSLWSSFLLILDKIRKHIFTWSSYEFLYQQKI